MQFRGREIAYTDSGRELLRRVREELGDTITVISEPKMEGRFMTMLVAPK